MLISFVEIQFVKRVRQFLTSKSIWLANPSFRQFRKL